LPTWFVSVPAILTDYCLVAQARLAGLLLALHAVLLAFFLQDAIQVQQKRKKRKE
jgi:hypothetical protein